MKFSRALVSASFALGAGFVLAQDAPVTPSSVEPVRQAVTPEAAEYRRHLVAAIELYKAGKTAEALTAFEALYAEDAKVLEVQSWLGFLYLESGQAARAVPLLEAASTTDPGNLETLNNLGSAYLNSGNPDAALVKFDRLAKLAPKLSQPQYNAGNILLAKGQNAEAAKYYRAAIVNDSNSAPIWNNLGVALDNQQDFAGSSDAFRKASELTPNSRIYARNAGLELQKAGRSKDAAVYLQRAVALGENDSKVLLTLGQIHTQNGQYAKAQEAYGKVAEGDRDRDVYWYNLGVLRQRANDYAGSEAAYRRAAAIDPENVSTLINLGLVQYQQGKYEDAREQFQGAMKLQPTNRAARRNFAAAAARSGHKAEAVKIWRDELQKDGEDSATRGELASALYESGDYEGARFHYKEILRNKPASPTALNGMGLLYLRELKLPQAEAAFRGAIAGDGKFVAAYNNLAVVMEKLNRRPQAISLLERANKIDPRNQDVIRNLRRLKSDS